MRSWPTSPPSAEVSAPQSSFPSTRASTPQEETERTTGLVGLSSYCYFPSSTAWHWRHLKLPTRKFMRDIWHILHSSPQLVRGPTAIEDSRLPPWYASEEDNCRLIRCHLLSHELLLTCISNTNPSPTLCESRPTFPCCMGCAKPCSAPLANGQQRCSSDALA